jgi:uncharacterized protein YjbJ (UPF0337 family)
MGTDKKIENTAEKAKGSAKEAAGKAVGNERLTAEGKTDKVKADISQAGQKIKDAFKD